MVNYVRTYAPRPCIQCEEIIESPRGPQRYCETCKGSRCLVDGCDNQIYAGGKCETHHRKKFPVTAITSIDGRCGVVGCGRPLKQKGMCVLHYGRAYRYGEIGDAKPRATSPIGAPCSVDGCGKPARGRGLCATHYQRWRTSGEVGGVDLLRASQGQGSIKDGYRIVAVDGEYLYEHRHVMQVNLGRSLRDDESVHHIDGDRLNNDPSNLELWSRYQPSGQRVRDKVRAAVKLLREHQDLLADEGLRLLALESQEATYVLVQEDCFENYDSIRGLMSHGV